MKKLCAVLLALSLVLFVANCKKYGKTEGRGGKEASTSPAEKFERPKPAAPDKDLLIIKKTPPDKVIEGAAGADAAPAKRVELPVAKPESETRIGVEKQEGNVEAAVRDEEPMPLQVEGVEHGYVGESQYDELPPQQEVYFGESEEKSDGSPEWFGEAGE